MKIELNKFYRTRDGRKARVICVDSKSDYPIIALIERDDLNERSAEFSSEGNIFRDNSESRLDLVSEWTEPKKQRRVFLWEFFSPSGFWRIDGWHKKEPDDNRAYRISPLCPEGILQGVE